MKRPKLANGVLVQIPGWELARAGDDDFVIAEKRKAKRQASQDLDCWSDLWQKIKANVFRLLGKNNRAKKFVRNIVSHE